MQRKIFNSPASIPAGILVVENWIGRLSEFESKPQFGDLLLLSSQLFLQQKHLCGLLAQFAPQTGFTIINLSI